VVGERRASRRALLKDAGAGLAAAGAFGLLGCGRSAPATAGTGGTSSTPIVPSDVSILAAALELERRTVAAYVAAIPLLDHDNAPMGRTFLEEELEQTGELIVLIRMAGGKASPRANSYAIGRARDQPQALALLHGFERLQIASYLQWVPRLSTASTRAAVASVMAADAQHIAVLRATSGEPALASAFVTGED